MRELRIQHEGGLTGCCMRSIRRAALLLLGGDKTGDDRWYEKFVPRADRLLREHLRELKDYRELRSKMSPEARARSQSKTQRMTVEMPLDELRAARQLTQDRLAALLNVNQSAVSKLERRADMYVSTLAGFIRAES